MRLTTLLKQHLVFAICAYFLKTMKHFPPHCGSPHTSSFLKIMRPPYHETLWFSHDCIWPPESSCRWKINQPPHASGSPSSHPQGRRRPNKKGGVWLFSRVNHPLPFPANKFCSICLNTWLILFFSMLALHGKWDLLLFNAFVQNLLKFALKSNFPIAFFICLSMFFWSLQYYKLWDG